MSIEKLINMQTNYPRRYYSYNKVHWLKLNQGDKLPHLKAQ